jgi:hypothetical protein
MPGSWTAEQVLAMAPDAGAARSATGLAAPRQWLRLGRSDVAAWGECQGSAKLPYQTEVELGEPAFRCTCPSRKFPCKHGLGLLLLLQRQPDAFVQGPPPDWVADWLASRAQRAQRRAERPPSASSAAAPGSVGPAVAPNPAAQERRAARREGRVAEGAAELERWVGDLVGQGLASAQARPSAFWERPAARLVDAQAPGLARRVREMAGLPASGQGWTGRLLEELARLHLLLRALGRLDALPPESQADVRALVGWTESQDEVRGAPGLRDKWAVLGRRVEDDGRLRTQRSWLRGLGTGRTALVLDFAAGGQPLDASLPPGIAFEGELSFFPGALPLRALVKERLGAAASLEDPPRGQSVVAAIDGYAAALARNPWLEQMPVVLDAVVPVQADDRWLARDGDGDALPLAPSFADGWTLRALSGGAPLGLFGEWDGDHLLPLGAWAEGEFHRL